MIGSRLRERRNTKTMTVKVKTIASGKHTEANVSGLSSLTATWEPLSPEETVTEGGSVVIVTERFWFDKLSDGTLPAIEEKHVLVDSSSVRYEVVRVKNQGGQGERLEVTTRRVR